MVGGGAVAICRPLQQSPDRQFPSVPGLLRPRRRSLRCGGLQACKTFALRRAPVLLRPLEQCSTAWARRRRATRPITSRCARPGRFSLAGGFAMTTLITQRTTCSYPRRQKDCMGASSSSRLRRAHSSGLRARKLSKAAGSQRRCISNSTSAPESRETSAIGARGIDDTVRPEEGSAETLMPSLHPGRRAESRKGLGWPDRPRYQDTYNRRTTTGHPARRGPRSLFPLRAATPTCIASPPGW